jgi:hypothetical protein
MNGCIRLRKWISTRISLEKWLRMAALAKHQPETRL